MARWDTPGLKWDTPGVFYDEPDAPLPTKTRMSKVKLGLQGMTPDQIVDLTNTIITAMTGNANFGTPSPTLAALTTAKTTAATDIAAYNSAKAAAETALAARDASVANLCSLLTLEAAYVQNASGGDLTKIESAGMNVQAEGAPLIMTQVLELVVSAGADEATLKARWKAVKGAGAYEIQISVDPPTSNSWTYKMTAKKSSAIISGLTSGARIWVRVRAIGADNATGPWSDPAVKTVP